MYLVLVEVIVSVIVTVHSLLTMCLALFCGELYWPHLTRSKELFLFPFGQPGQRRLVRWCNDLAQGSQEAHGAKSGSQVSDTRAQASSHC